jgi:hypothetical protein
LTLSVLPQYIASFIPVWRIEEKGTMGRLMHPIPCLEQSTNEHMHSIPTWIVQLCSLWLRYFRFLFVQLCSPV